MYPEYPHDYKPTTWTDEDGFQLSYHSNREPFYWLWTKFLLDVDCPDAPSKPVDYKDPVLMVVKFNNEIGYVWLNQLWLDDVNYDIWAEIAPQIKAQFRIAT